MQAHACTMCRVHVIVIELVLVHYNCTHSTQGYSFKVKTLQFIVGYQAVTCI